MKIRRRWLVLGLSVLFLALLYGVLRSQMVDAVDHHINSVLGPYRSEEALKAFLWVTALGANPAIFLVCAIATTFLWSQHQFHIVGGLWIAFVGAEATSWSFKYLADRERPPFLDGATATSPSFPSGHSASSMAVYGFLALVFMCPTWKLRPLVPFVLAFLIMLIGFSRMLLSLHYASDVMGGYLIGSIWLLIGMGLVEKPGGLSSTS